MNKLYKMDTSNLQIKFWLVQDKIHAEYWRMNGSFCFENILSGYFSGRVTYTDALATGLINPKIKDLQVLYT